MKSLRQIALSTGLLAAIVTTGCTLGPDYQRPAVATPIAWKESSPAPANTGRELPSAWWTIFGDAELDAIERQVVEANHDLQRAAARVTEARVLARMSAAERYPNLTADASHSRLRTSGNRAGAFGPAREASDHSAQLSLGFELDFWGRVRRSSDATRADADAAEADHRATALFLTAEAAQHYWQLRSLDAERAVLDATLASRRDALRLQETRHHAGLINEVDVTRARTELASVEAEVHAVVRSRARLEHALAVLAARPPANFAVATRAGAFALPEVPAGLPSSLLQRRPDLAASEHQLAAASARIGVARADLLPRISLTGAAGFASSDLGSLLRGDSRVWSFGPNVHLPLFDGGRNRANVAAAEARHEQSTAAYRSAVLNAFREVEDALSDLAALGAQREAVNRSLLSARDTGAFATERHQRGLSNYLDVVDAQRAALHAERLVAQLDGQRTIATVLLVRALGGGWDPAAEQRSVGILTDGKVDLDTLPRIGQK